MGIPEHDKLVKVQKKIRKYSHSGNWRNVRRLRRKNGEFKYKQRIRQMLKVERWYALSQEKKKGFRLIPYSRYGKYDD